MAIEQEVEQAAPTEHSKNDLRYQRGIRRLDARVKRFVQDVARIRASRFYSVQHIIGDSSCARDGHCSQLTTEAFAGHNSCAIREFRASDSFAAFHLDMFDAQDTRASTDHEQPIFACRENDSRFTSRRNWLERPAPNLNRFPAERREGAGPWLHTANLVVDELS